MAIQARPLASPPAQPHGAAAPALLRRCTFRRMALKAPAGSRQLPQYEVSCTFPDRRKAVALGDLESARPVCESCTYQGIFRPDSD
jgi:hypothetical protein